MAATRNGAAIVCITVAIGILYSGAPAAQGRGTRATIAPGSPQALREWDARTQSMLRTGELRTRQVRPDTLIPGHGAPMARDDFVRWRAAFDAWLGCAASDGPAAQCAENWLRDAAGFYTAAEAEGVRMLAEAYVAEVLRAPASERMAYCRA